MKSLTNAFSNRQTCFIKYLSLKYLLIPLIFTLYASAAGADALLAGNATSVYNTPGYSINSNYTNWFSSSFNATFPGSFDTRFKTSFPKINITGNFVPNNNETDQTQGFTGYITNQSKCSGAVQYDMDNGFPYLFVPTSGYYRAFARIQAYNNNGGSVEWNQLSFVISYYPADGSGEKTWDTYNPYQNGGGCNSCSQYSVSYTYIMEPNAIYLQAGTQVVISGNVTDSGTSCGGNSVLIQNGVLSVVKTAN